MDPRRIFALRINAVTLKNIRQTRMEKLRMQPGSDYGDLGKIRREISHARRLFDEHPEWTQVDVSRKAVEEAATTVLEAYRAHFPLDGAPTGTQDDAVSAPTSTPPPPTPSKRKGAGKKAASKKSAPKNATRKRAAPKKKAGK